MADDQGRPIAFALTPGNVADITIAIPLLDGIALPRRLVAAKAYDADSLRSWLRAHRPKAVIPSNATCNKPYPLDRAAYRRRNVIERVFGKLKNWGMHRNLIRSRGEELPRRNRHRLHRHRMELNESPT